MSPAGIPSMAARRGHIAVLALIFSASLWLRSAFPVWAIGDTAHDDMLFIKLSASISAGDWLGKFDQLTLAKGAAFPVFLSLNQALGWPLELTEHALYLVSALYFSVLFGRSIHSAPAVAISFLILAMNPLAWNPAASARVMREGIYVTQTLLLIALAMHCFSTHRADSKRSELRQKWPLLALFGITAGIYWLTREEGLWLAPALGVLALHGLWLPHRRQQAWRHRVTFLVVPMLCACVPVIMVNAVNQHYYGSFRNNDFRSPDFQAAYGALSRIKHDHWQRYVVFPFDARQRAYRFSAAARELQPYLDGPPAQAWREAGCRQTRITPCPEILSGWFMWALRDAVAATGRYDRAESAQSFYRQLASEINHACEQFPDECNAARQTLLPPWRNHYLHDTAIASGAILQTLIGLDGAPVAIGISHGTPEQLVRFRKLTHSSLNISPAKPDVSMRYQLAQGIAKLIAPLSRIGAPLAVAAWFLWLAHALYRGSVPVALVIASALITAVAARVVLLGFLEASSIPSNNILYLSPVVPLLLVLIPVTFFGILASRRAQSHE